MNINIQYGISLEMSASSLTQGWPTGKHHEGPHQPYFI